MFNRAKNIKLKFLSSQYSNSEVSRLKNSSKYGCIAIAFMQRLEYAQSLSGRSTSFRSRGKMSSVVVRNKKYGIEARFILYNPRLVILR